MVILITDHFSFPADQSSDLFYNENSFKTKIKNIYFYG